MNETSVANVDADMRESTFQRIEEYEVARLQLFDRNGLPELADGARAMRQCQVGRLLEYIAHETAAIETCFRGFATVFVSDTGQTEGVDQNFLRGIRPSGFGLCRFLHGLIRVGEHAQTRQPDGRYVLFARHSAGF